MLFNKIRYIIYIFLLVCIFLFTLDRFTDFFSENEYFNDQVYNPSYKCSANLSIYDELYIKVYSNLYSNSHITDIKIDVINENLKHMNKIVKTTLYNIDKQNNNILIVWPHDNNFLHFFKRYKLPYTTIAQNDFMKEYLLKTEHSDSFVSDLTNVFSFEPETYSHIIVDDFSFYKLSFKDQMTFIENAISWLRFSPKNDDNYIMLQLIDDSLASDCNRNFFLSSKHTNDEINDGIITFDDYTVKTNFRCSSENAEHKYISVKEVAKISANKNRHIYEYCLNITPLKKIINKFKSHNFIIYKKIHLSDVNHHYDNQYIYIFKRSPSKSNTESNTPNFFSF